MSLVFGVDASRKGSDGNYRFQDIPWKVYVLLRMVC